MSKTKKNTGKKLSKKSPIDKNIYIILGLIVVLTLIIFVLNQNNQDKGKVIATVNGDKVYEQELLDFLVNTYNVPENFNVTTLPVDQQSSIIKQYYTESLVLDAAYAAGIAQEANTAKAIENTTGKIVKEAFLEKIAEEGTNRAAIEAYYQEQKAELEAELAGKEEVKARHILIKDKAAADKIYAALKNGSKDFKEAAEEESLDQFSGKNGGDLGYFTEDKMVPEFAKQAFALKVGQISKPFKTQFGWHIVKVEDRRAAEIPSLDDMYEKLKQELSYKAVSDYVSNLSKDLNVEINRDFAPVRSNDLSLDVDDDDDEDEEEDGDDEEESEDDK